MSDLIDRQSAIDEIEERKNANGYRNVAVISELNRLEGYIMRLPSAQPDYNADISEINKFIDGLEEIFADIRERHVDDSVCGLCEYDGAYMGQSGDWCNECPGFDKDDCFKLSDETRKKWIEKIVNTYPDNTADIGKKAEGDCISRQTAIDAIEHRLAEPAYQHTGEDWYVGMNCAESELYDLPSAQPEITYRNCSDALLKMWMDNVLTDGEYNRIMDKLNQYDAERRTDDRSD